MAGLSISTAWDESRAIIAHDGKLFASVALALVALPAAISDLVAPQGLFGEPQAPLWATVVALIASIIALAGQLALVRLALGPSITVGEAIGHGLRRLPIFVVAAFLVGLALFVAAIPFAIVLVASGVSLEGKSIPATPTVVVAAILYFVLLCFVFVRMLMSTPVASSEQLGPIAIIRRSWQLTSGQWWHLFAFFLIFMIGAAILQIAVGSAVGLVVLTLFGPADPLSTSALILALAQAVVAAALAVLLTTMLARIYVQLAGREPAAGVPNSGA